MEQSRLVRAYGRVLRALVLRRGDPLVGFALDELAGFDDKDRQRRTAHHSDKSFSKSIQGGLTSILFEAACSPEVVRVGIEQQLSCQLPQIGTFGRGRLRMEVDRDPYHVIHPRRRSPRKGLRNGDGCRV